LLKLSLDLRGFLLSLKLTGTLHQLRPLRLLLA
jgi:hypothetical protein